MKITCAPEHLAKGCNECLKKNVPLFTIQTVMNKLTLCEYCMKEAVTNVTTLAIKARELRITRGQP